jgi:hypothetical protein
MIGIQKIPLFIPLPIRPPDESDTTGLFSPTSQDRSIQESILRNAPPDEAMQLACTETWGMLRHEPI